MTRYSHMSFSSTKPHRSPSILVSGPPGVGKRAVIQAVARRSRMNIVEASICTAASVKNEITSIFVQLDCFEFVSEVVVYAERKLMVDLDNGESSH